MTDTQYRVHSTALHMVTHILSAARLTHSFDEPDGDEVCVTVVDANSTDWHKGPEGWGCAGMFRLVFEDDEMTFHWKASL